MGRRAVDDFARLYVLPQTGHGLTGNSASIDGNGAAVQPAAIELTIAIDEVVVSLLIVIPVNDQTL